MKNVIIGTAGHVDHGKSQLIKALTGIDTDRLREEKKRGISIELGFSYLTLPSGRWAGIVDVPGHERFIKHMLAGVSGIDLVLLVIAADEGVMPQTKEHMDILQLLQVKNGIVVLTKIDLVDQDWLELVQEEIKEFLAGTMLENAPLVLVSSLTGEGLPELLQAIDHALINTTQRTSAGKMRLPVDRVFSVTGFGTVVTGTMVAGSLAVGDEVVIMPAQIDSRVRGLQIHGQKVNLAQAGQRVAINLTGVEVADIERGFVISSPGTLTPSYRLDAKLHLLNGITKPLKHRTRVRLHIGTDEIMCRVILLDRQELTHGQNAYVQLQLEDTAVASKGDRFVIRSYSPMHTIGGGVVIDPVPSKHKRFDKTVIKTLVTKAKGTPEELLLQYLIELQVPVNSQKAAEELKIAPEELRDGLKKLLLKKQVKTIDTEDKILLVSMQQYKRWVNDINNLLVDYHQSYPLREGYPKEELRSRMFTKQNSKVFQYILQQMDKDGLVKQFPQTIAQPDFFAHPTGQAIEIIDKIESFLKSNHCQPPSWKEVLETMQLKSDEGVEYQSYLLRNGKIVKLSEEIYFHTETIDQVQEKITSYLKENDSISIAETRDILKTSRKYALPLLEYFDRKRITRRVGDNRVLSTRNQ